MKKKLLFLGCALVSAISFAQIPTSGLVGYYPFNGNANDESANSNDGTVNGATLTTDRFGNTNSAYSFDGVNDIIQINSIGNASFENNFTISLWCSFTDFNNDYPHLIFGENSFIVLNGNGPAYSTDSLKISGYQGPVLNPSLRRTPYVSSVSKLNKGSYYHVVFVKNDTTASFYVNGVLENSVKVDSTLTLPTGQFLQIGNGYDNGANYAFKGEIDDVRIYGKAVSECEITSLFNENDMKLKVTVQDTLNIYLSNVITTVYEPADAVTTVKVYPNPSANNITVEIDNYANLSGVTLKVINSQSAEVHNEAVTGATQSIDISTWSAGIYFLQVLNGSDIVDIRKIVVNN